MKLIDKSKKSNRRCCNCAHWSGGSSDEGMLCLYRNETKNYWNCCKNFEWSRGKQYVQRRRGTMGQWISVKERLPDPPENPQL